MHPAAVLACRTRAPRVEEEEEEEEEDEEEKEEEEEENLAYRRPGVHPRAPGKRRMYRGRDREPSQTSTAIA